MSDTYALSPVPSRRRLPRVVGALAVGLAAAWGGGAAAHDEPTVAIPTRVVLEAAPAAGADGYLWQRERCVMYAVEDRVRPRISQSGLTSGSVYRWRVRAYRDEPQELGPWSPWSDVAVRP